MAEFSASAIKVSNIALILPYNQSKVNKEKKRAVIAATARFGQEGMELFSDWIRRFRPCLESDGGTVNNYLGAWIFYRTGHFELEKTAGIENCLRNKNHSRFIGFTYIYKNVVAAVDRIGTADMTLTAA